MFGLDNKLGLNCGLSKGRMIYWCILLGDGILNIFIGMGRWVDLGFLWLILYSFRFGIFLWVIFVVRILIVM